MCSASAVPAGAAHPAASKNPAALSGAPEKSTCPLAIKKTRSSRSNIAGLG